MPDTQKPPGVRTADGPDTGGYDEVDWTVCHPNRTQSCTRNFYLKNGVPIRAEQIYLNEQPGATPSGCEHADVSQHWNPSGCMKGLTLHRRTCEPSRIKYVGEPTAVKVKVEVEVEGEVAVHAPPAAGRVTPSRHRPARRRTA